MKTLAEIRLPVGPHAEKFKKKHPEVFNEIETYIPDFREPVKRVSVVEFDIESWAPYFAIRSQAYPSCFLLFEPVQIVKPPEFWERWDHMASDEDWSSAYFQWFQKWKTLTNGRVPFPVSGPELAVQNQFDEEISEIAVKDWFASWLEKVGLAIAKMPPPRTLSSP